MDESNYLIVGAKGQLGLALQQQYPRAKHTDITELDITDRRSVESYDWTNVKVIFNAAAYTNVDGAETADGRRIAWLVNAVAVGYLHQIAIKNDITLIHLSTDYVFDGTRIPHSEVEQFSPINVYGATKAAGDILVAQVPKHYILRSSWVIGEGLNFVRTMLEMGKKHMNPSTVNDQIGRLTFTNEIVRAIDHLLTKQCPFGTYNVSNDGDGVSWADITREIFKIANLTNSVTDITTEQYYKDKVGVAPRPLHSALDLSKIHATGFVSNQWRADLAAYVAKELQT